MPKSRPLTNPGLAEAEQRAGREIDAVAERAATAMHVKKMIQERAESAPITKEALIAAGYKPFKHHEKVCDETGYQKLFCSSEPRRNYALPPSNPKLLYSVEVYIWYFAKHFPGRGAPEVSVNSEARLYLPEGNPLVGTTGFTLTLHLDKNATIPAMEAFYAKAFAALDCVPDLHNND